MRLWIAALSVLFGSFSWAECPSQQPLPVPGPPVDATRAACKLLGSASKAPPICREATAAEDDEANGFYLALDPAYEFTSGQQGQWMLFHTQWYEKPNAKTGRRRRYFWDEGEWDAYPFFDQREDGSRVLAGTIQDMKVFSNGLKVSDGHGNRAYVSDFDRSYQFLGRCRYVSDYERGIHKTLNCYLYGRGFELERNLGKVTVSTAHEISGPGGGLYDFRKMGAGRWFVLGGFTSNASVSGSIHHVDWSVTPQVQIESSFIPSRQSLSNEEEYNYTVELDFPHHTALFFENSFKPGPTGLPAGSADNETIRRIGFQFEPKSLGSGIRKIKRRFHPVD